MARKRKEPDVIMQVEYVADPDNIQAAQELLKKGFQRAYLKLLCEQQQKPPE